MWVYKWKIVWHVHSLKNTSVAKGRSFLAGRGTSFSLTLVIYVHFFLPERVFSHGISDQIQIL
jgi:hypothetical protein